MVRGTSPPCLSTRPRAKPVMLRAFARKKPVERMISSTSARGAAASLGASPYLSKRRGVTWLTRSSVHWADRIVATASSKALR